MTKLDGSGRTRGKGRMRAETEANPAILVITPGGPPDRRLDVNGGLPGRRHGAGQGEDCGFSGLPITSSGASFVALFPGEPYVGDQGLAFGHSVRPLGGTVSSRHLPCVATSR